MLGAEVGGGYGAIIGGAVGLVAGGIGGYVEGEKKDEIIAKQKQAGEKALQRQHESASLQAREAAKQKAAAQNGSGDQLMILADLKDQKASGWNDVESKGMVFTEKRVSKGEAKSPVAPQLYGNPKKSVA
jgi:hypothetical protein